MSAPILHIAYKEGWLTALKEGEYIADSLVSEGFIHCSTPAQALRVANSLYLGQGGLVLLVIEPHKLKAELKWEPPSGGPPEAADRTELFPHLYGPLNLDAVNMVLDFEPDSDGYFQLPNIIQIKG